MNSQQLIQRYLQGDATDAEFKELDRLLAKDPALRRHLIKEAGIDTCLREVALERISGDRVEKKIINHPFGKLAMLATAAVIALLASMSWTRLTQPKVIATLVSGEDASWESSLPTTVGSPLTNGSLKLTSGIATIRFNSGAVVTLEAPANLVLETAMRGKLLDGSAIIDVPESAIGFVIDTPNGYAVDHGTIFAVNVGHTPGVSDFEVLEGEISVHEPSSGKEVRLKQEQTATIAEQVLTTFDGPLPEPPPKKVKKFKWIRANDRCQSIISNDRFARVDYPEMMLVRNPGDAPGAERRALLSFEVKPEHLESTNSATLRLNLVESGIGYATRLPKHNHFAVYGISDESKEDYPLECHWDDAPSPNEGVLIGRFQLRRSKQQGHVNVTSDALLEFLRSDTNGTVGFLIVRESGEVDHNGVGFVHAFATSSHPERAGPSLRLGIEH